MNYSNSVFDSPGIGKSPYGARRWADTPLKRKDQYTKKEFTPAQDFDIKFQSPNEHSSPNSTVQSEKLDNNNADTVKNEEPLKKSKTGKIYNTLIPTEVIDVGSQRAIVCAVWAIIQGYKLYDLAAMKIINNKDNTDQLSRYMFLFKYFLLETTFLYTLPIFRIPKLTFKPFVIYFFIILSALTNLLISSSQMVPFLTLVVTAWSTLNPKKVTISGDTVNYNKIIDSSSHFKGKHIIKILPENTALFNPLHDSYCLSESYGVYSVQVPIRINSTSDIEFLQLEYKDLYTNEKSLINISASSVNNKLFKTSKTKTKSPLLNKIVNNEERLKLLNKDSINNDESSKNVQYFNITLDSPGHYQMTQLIDKDNFQLKLYKSNLVISECPSVSFKKPEVQLSFDRCLGSEDTVSIHVQGVPPLKLQYGKRIGNDLMQEVIIDDTSLQPSNFLDGDISPLMTNQLTTKLTRENIEDLKWAQKYDVEINLKAVAKEEGLHGYHIYSIVDGFGNVVDRDTLIKQESNELDYEYLIHGEPKVTMSDKFNSKSSSKRSLVIRSEDNQDSSALDLQILYREHESDDYQIMHHTLKNKYMEIMAKKPGEYVLNKVKSQFCPGFVLGENKVLVTEPIPPQMTVESSPILDQCTGPIGLDFNLVFTGVAPFEFTTKIYKIDPRTNQRFLYDTKKRKSHGTRHHFSFNPNQVGSYEIEFVDVSNNIFERPIKLEPASNYIFKTSMKVKPAAKINNRNNGVEKLCLDTSRVVSVDLRGEPPFTLKYDITATSTNERQSFVSENIMANSIQLDTPQFNKGGDYIFSLASIQDSTGCVVPLSGEDLSFQVRRIAPSAEFNFVDEHNRERVIKQGSSTFLPLRLIGDPPFQIGYELISADGKSESPVRFTTISNKARPQFQLKEEGTYKLVSVQDNSCKGFVGISDTFKISYLTTPKLKVLDHSTSKINKVNDFKYIKQDVCQNMEGLIEMQFDGLAPFNVTYDIVKPSGSILRNKRLQALTSYAAIKLPNDESGEYKVVIKNVNDMNYPDNVNMKPIEINQNVFKKPNLKISNKNGVKSFRTCFSNIDEPSAYLEPINLQYLSSNAVGLFKVTFKIFHETSGKTEFVTLNTIQKQEGNNILDIDYKQLYSKLKMGSYVISIDRIVDSITGCVGKDLSLSSFTITITDVPTISLLEPSLDYCVGDYVTYQLNGQSPFEIKYSFNKKKLKTTEHSSKFVRLAGEAGEISINSIQDTQAKCLVNFNKPGMEHQFKELSLKIHEKPTVTVSQGDIYEEDIHEGDQAEIIFSFEGEMPFQLKYVRMDNEMGDIGDLKNIEIFTVNDIYQNEYRIVTSLQGIYEAIEITDRFCTSRKEAFFK